MPKWDSGVRAWERQKGESEKAFEAFSCYRDMGADRTISAVVKELEKSRTLIDRWKERWDWEERVRAYDNDLERQAYKKAVKSMTEMHTRHIKTAVLMQKKAVEALDSININELSANDIVKLITGGSKLERETRSSDPAVVSEQQRAAEQGTSGLADAIIEAWQRRKEGDDD